MIILFAWVWRNWSCTSLHYHFSKPNQVHNCAFLVGNQQWYTRYIDSYIIWQDYFVSSLVCVGLVCVCIIYLNISKCGLFLGWYFRSTWFSLIKRCYIKGLAEGSGIILRCSNEQAPFTALWKTCSNRLRSKNHITPFLLIKCPSAESRLHSLAFLFLFHS